MEELIVLGYLLYQSQPGEQGSQLFQVHNGTLRIEIPYLLHHGILGFFPLTVKEIHLFAHLMVEQGYLIVFIGHGSNIAIGIHHALDNKPHLCQKLVTSRQHIGLLDRPEPQRTPIVHGKAQPCIRPGVLLLLGLVALAVDFVFSADGGVAVHRIILMTVDREIISCLCLYLLTQLYLLFPQVIYLLRQLQHNLDVITIIRFREPFLPCFDFLDVLRLQSLDNFIRIVCHTRVTSKEVVDLGFRLSRLRQIYTLWSILIPASALSGGSQGIHMVTLPPCPNKRVTIYQLCTKPRNKTTLMDGIQPKGHFCQLHSGGIQVNTIHIPVSDEHLDLLQLFFTFIIRNGFPIFSLSFLQIGFS